MGNIAAAASASCADSKVRAEKFALAHDPTRHIDIELGKRTFATEDRACARKLRTSEKGAGAREPNVHAHFFFVLMTVRKTRAGNRGGSQQVSYDKRRHRNLFFQTRSLQAFPKKVNNS